MSKFTNQQQVLNPFSPFINKINNDLTNWLAKEKQIKSLVQDYKNTLNYLNDDFNPNQSSKLIIDHGQNIYSKAKTIDDKVVIRVKQGLFVQMDKQQSIRTVRSLIQLYKQKGQMCQKQVAKIMTTMRQVQDLIKQYNNLPTQ